MWQEIVSAISCDLFADHEDDMTNYLCICVNAIK